MSAQFIQELDDAVSYLNARHQDPTLKRMKKPITFTESQWRRLQTYSKAGREIMIVRVAKYDFFNMTIHDVVGTTGVHSLELRRAGCGELWYACGNKGLHFKTKSQIRRMEKYDYNKFVVFVADRELSEPYTVEDYACEHGHTYTDFPKARTCVCVYDL